VKVSRIFTKFFGFSDF